MLATQANIGSILSLFALMFLCPYYDLLLTSQIVPNIDKKNTRNAIDVFVLIWSVVMMKGASVMQFCVVTDEEASVTEKHVVLAYCGYVVVPNVIPPPPPPPPGGSPSISIDI